MASPKKSAFVTPEESDRVSPNHTCVNVNGIAYPSFASAARWKEGLAEMKEQFPCTDDTVLICTFPKCGTTMTQQICHLLRNKGEQTDKTMMETCPWADSAWVTKGKEGFEQMTAGLPAPPIYKTHASLPLFFADVAKPKFIFVSRNPKDTAVSMFHHFRSKVGFQYSGEWDDFFAEEIMKDRVENNSFWEWTREWRAVFESGKARAIWLMYEDMVADMPAAVRQIADFCGIEASDELVARVAELSTLDSMKQNKKANCSWIETKEGEPGHLRKGGKGGWREYFSEEQARAFDTRTEKELGQFKDLVFDYGA